MKVNFRPDPKGAPKEKKAKKPIAKRSKIAKHSATSLHAVFSLACIVFQRWIRKRDQGQPCISCNRFFAEYDAGHRYKKELYSGFVFEEELCHNQCTHCNRMLDGNEKGYVIGLERRIGKEQAEHFEGTKNEMREKKWTRVELNKIIEKYQTN